MVLRSSRTYHLEGVELFEGQSKSSQNRLRYLFAVGAPSFLLAPTPGFLLCIF
jgi:hypothetical protein